jgi:hypothetical protein
MVGETAEDRSTTRRTVLPDGGESESSDGEGDESEESEADEGEDEAEETESEGAEEEEEEAEEAEEAEEKEEEEQEEEAEEEGEDEEGATVLYLDIGDGLFLNLLGLEVDLAEVELDVSAVPGDNRLVGNLLNAVAGLLDKPSLPDFGDMLGGIGGKVTDSIRDAGSAVMEELDLGQLFRDLLSGFVDELGGGSDGESDDESGGEGGNGNGSEE